MRAVHEKKSTTFDPLQLTYPTIATNPGTRSFQTILFSLYAHFPLAHSRTQTIVLK